MNKIEKDVALGVVTKEYIEILKYWIDILNKRRIRLEECCAKDAPQAILKEKEKLIVEALEQCEKYTKLIQDTVADMESYKE